MQGIEIVGLGPGSSENLTLEALEILENAEALYLRTESHPTVDFLKAKGITFQSFDYIYDSKEDFSQVYSEIANTLVTKALEGERVTYAVPGHPLMGETSVHMVIKAAKEENIPVKIIKGDSFLTSLLPLIMIEPFEGISIIDGSDIDIKKVNPNIGTIIVQIYNTRIASNVKLALTELYPDEHRVLLVKAAGVAGEEYMEWLHLYEIDRADWLEHLTSLYVPPLDENIKREGCKWPLDPLVEIMESLRGENGCPWDKEQTHKTLRPYAIEEAYEVAEAVDSGSIEELQEELGDLLLQVVFHAQIGRENKTFDVNSIVQTIVEKMIRRHPHVFGDVKIDTASGVLVNWEKIKKKEKGTKDRESILDGIPKDMPALSAAYKMQDKAARVGFDWDDIEGPLKKVFEEAEELKDVVQGTYDKERIEEEFGDLLFAIVNVGRFLEVQPELALRGTLNKFYNRFRQIEEEAKRRRIRLQDMTLTEMDEIWEKAKKK